MIKRSYSLTMFSHFIIHHPGEDAALYPRAALHCPGEDAALHSRGEGRGWESPSCRRGRAWPRRPAGGPRQSTSLRPLGFGLARLWPHGFGLSESALLASASRSPRSWRRPRRLVAEGELGPTGMLEDQGDLASKRWPRRWPRRWPCGFGLSASTLSTSASRPTCRRPRGVSLWPLGISLVGLVLAALLASSSQRAVSEHWRLTSTRQILTMTRSSFWRFASAGGG